jgi:isoquinoline 1-oxidoreductase beta subunit
MAMLEKQPRFANVLKQAVAVLGWAPAGFPGMALMDGYDTHLAQVMEISVKDNQITVQIRWLTWAMVNPTPAQIMSALSWYVRRAEQ